MPRPTEAVLHKYDAVELHKYGFSRFIQYLRFWMNFNQVLYQ